MMNETPPNGVPPPRLDLVPVSKTLKELGHSVRPANLTELIERLHIVVLAQIPLGRGIMPMMSKQQADELLAKAKPPVPEAYQMQKNDLHVAALELKVDKLAERLAAEVKGNTQAMAEMVRASNLLADRLDRVLKEMGSHS